MEIIAFTAEHVRRLTGLSARQLGYWDKTDFFSPTIVEGGGPYSKIYSFRDVVGLRVIAILRRSVPLQELRRVGEWLKQKHDTPWSSLRLALAGRKVAYCDESVGEYVEAGASGQQVFAVDEIAESMREAANRLRDREDKVGQIVRNRNIVHNAWVVAGTRIPIAAIHDFHEAGYSPEQIIREYPRLTATDVQAALAHRARLPRAA